MTIYELTNLEDFNEKVLKSNQLCVVNFFATWCGPCRRLAPEMEEFSKTYTNASFFKVDVDEIPELAEQNGIRSVPTIIYFKNGQKVNEFAGADAQKIEKIIKNNIS